MPRILLVLCLLSTLAIAALLAGVILGQRDPAYSESNFAAPFDEPSISETTPRSIRAHSLMPYFSFSSSPFPRR